MATRKRSRYMERDRHQDSVNSSRLDTIPKELLSAILSRLPVESLLRLKCLNRSWYFLIKFLVKDPKFVTDHLHNSEAASDQILLLSSHRRRAFRLPEKNAYVNHLITSIRAIQTFDEDNGGLCSVNCVTQDLNFPQHLIRGAGRLASCCCCNGVICLTGDFRTFTLYNPALREYETFHPATSRKGLTRADGVVGMGFGCDSTARDYKIIRFFYSMEAEIFTPGGTNCDYWRKIGVNIEGRRIKAMRSSVYIKAKCFWLITCEQYSILCFNVGSEEFLNIPLPTEPNDYFWNLARYNDSLCAAKTDKNWSSDMRVVDMWVMDTEDSARGNSWTNFLRIKCYSAIYTQVRFWKSSVILVDHRMRRDFIKIHNIPSGEEECLFGDVTLKDVFLVDRYIKSLVSVKGMNQPRPRV